MVDMSFSLTIAKASIAVAAMIPTSTALGHGARSAVPAPPPVHHVVHGQSTALAPRTARIRSGRTSASVTLTAV
jgi:hypothetical protein